MRASRIALVVGMVALARPWGAAAQQSPPRITVQVQQVAGSSLYLNAGTRNGLAEGDTLTVPGEKAGTVRGKLVVLASSDTRSVLTFAGRPFAVTRGTTLVLQLLRVPAELPPDVAQAATPSLQASSGAAEAPAMPERQVRAPIARPAHGRVTFGFSGVRSATRIGGADPISVGRTFATPTTGLDLTVPNALGPFQLRTSMYLAYRYSNQDIIQPAMVARVYAASLEGDFRRFRIELGRFHSPVESYGGFWDGALVRVGGSGFGVGAIGGYEPDRWDERPSLTTPKAAVFMDANGRGPGWGWSGSLSAHATWPSNGFPDHTFFQTSQRFYAGAMRLNDEVQVDQDPTGGWRVSRVRLRASLQLASWLNVNGGVGRLEPWLPGLFTTPFGFRSDRADVGLDFRMGGGYASLDGFMGREGTGGRTWGASGMFAVNRLPGLPRVGASASVSRWSGTYGTTMSAAPSLAIDLSPAWLRFGYRWDQSNYLDRLTISHAVDAGLDFPFASGFRGSARLQVQLGGILTSQSFNLSLYRAF